MLAAKNDTAPPAVSDAPLLTQTKISIDGSGDDWKGRPVLWEDAAGDAEKGYLDLTTGYGFINQHAAYLLINVVDIDAPLLTLIEMNFDLGPKKLRLGWRPDKNRPAWIADVTTGWERIGEVAYSSFALGPAFEARIDLRDLGSPEYVTLTRIDVRVKVDSTWRIADRLTAYFRIPVLSEADPAWRLAEIGGAAEAERLLSAPDTRAISIHFDPAKQRAKIKGEAGAVPAGAMVLVNSLELSDFTTLRADILGRFEAEVAAVPGSHILVKQDVTGRIIRSSYEGRTRNVGDMIAAGVLLYIPKEESGEGISFSAASRICRGGCSTETIIPWSITGKYEDDTLAPGQRFRISGQVTLFADDSAAPPTSRLRFHASMLGDAEGRQVGRSGKFVTAFLTATGLPIERTFGGPPLGKISLGTVDLSWEFDGRNWVADFSATLKLPSGAMRFVSLKSLLPKT